MYVCTKGPGPPDDDSPLESQLHDLGTTLSRQSRNLNNNHTIANLNHSHKNNNNNHIHGSHTDKDKKEQTNSRQGSFECVSCSSKNCSGAGDEVESPNETYTETTDSDVFDWWFQRNRNSKKSR